MARLVVKEVCIAAIDRVGGEPAALVPILASMGFSGHGGEDYNEKSIEAWPTGRRAPSATTLIAMAIKLRISLDGIVAAAEASVARMQEARLAFLEERPA